MAALSDLIIHAFRRHREQTFGTAPLDVLHSTPESGESVAGSISEGWMGQRARSITSPQSTSAETGLWQFQIIESGSTAALLTNAVAIIAGGRRFKIKKVEKPVGAIRTWKLRAEIQTDAN